MDNRAGSIDGAGQMEAESVMCDSDVCCRSTFDAMLEGCQIIDHQWRYLYLNSAALRQSRKTSLELYGRTVMEAYPQIEGTELLSELCLCMECRCSRHMVTTFCFSDGGSGVFELSIQPIPEGLFILSVDVTQHRQAEEDLRKSEENLRMFIEHTPAAIAMFDREMKYIAVSHRYYTDYGLREKSIIGRSHYEVFPEITEQYKEVHRRCLAGATEKSEAEPFPRLTGEVDWVKWEICPWYAPGGQIGGIILFSEVVTEHKNTEKALRTSEQRWKFALEGSGDGVWDWDCKTDKVYYSTRWKSMLSYRKAEVGDTIEEVTRRIHPDNRVQTIEKINQMRRGQATRFSSEHRLLCRDGSYKWVLARGMVVTRDETGVPLRIIGTQADIGNLKRVQESLIKSVRANRLLSRCNEYLVRSSSEPQLLKDICRAIVEQGNYLFAWVCFDEADNPAVHWGSGNSLPQRLECGKSGGAECPAQAVITPRKPIVIQNVSLYPRVLPMLSFVEKDVVASFIALPLVSGGAMLGTLNLFSGDQDAFDEEEIKVLTELANDLAYGLTDLRLQDRHRRVVEALTASESKYRSLFESANEAILMADVETMKIEFANPAACRMLGYSAQALSKLGLVDLHPAEAFQSYVLPEFEAQLSGAKNLSSDIPFRRKDGSVIHGDVNATIMEIDGKRVLTGFITDVTQRRKAADERKNAEHSLLGAMTKTVELISKTVELRDPYTAGHQGRVTVLAAAIARNLGLSESDVTGIRMAAVVHDLGKLFVPAEILSKPGKLTDLELALIKTHPQAGYDVLKEVDFPLAHRRHHPAAPRAAERLRVSQGARGRRDCPGCQDSGGGRRGGSHGFPQALPARHGRHEGAQGDFRQQRQIV